MITSHKNTFKKLVHQLQQFQSDKPRIFELAMAGGVFVFILIYSLQRIEQPFFYDSLNYWNLADSFVKSGEFAFINYNSVLRGYFFPFVLFILKSLGPLLGVNAKQLFYIFSALCFSIYTIYVLPGAFHSIFRWKTHFRGRAMIVIFLFIFWRGHFLYPLTDFPAFIALLISIALLSLPLRGQITPVWAFLIGFFISAAVNIRPAYLLALTMLIPFIIIKLSQLKILKAMQWIIFFLLGCIFVLLPQYRINQTHFQVNSPWVLTRFADDENLFVKQLFWGLRTQKYETNIGDNYLSAAAVYQDPLFDMLPANLLKEKALSNYVEILKRYPQDVAISYFRHFFNGIDLFFPTPYVKNIFADYTAFRVVNYLIWLLAFCFFLRTDFARVDRGQLAGVLALLAPVFLAIPAAVEVRFFLPIHILAYGIVSFGLDYNDLVASIRANKWNILRAGLVLTLWIMIFFTLSAATAKNLVGRP